MLIAFPLIAFRNLFCCCCCCCWFSFALFLWPAFSECWHQMQATWTSGPGRSCLLPRTGRLQQAKLTPVGGAQCADMIIGHEWVWNASFLELGWEADRSRRLHGLNFVSCVTMKEISRCDSYEWSSVMHFRVQTQINWHCCQTAAMESWDLWWTF